MHRGTQEEMSRRQKLNDISSGEDDALSDVSDEGSWGQDVDFVPQSQYDNIVNQNNIYLEEQKHQDINLRQKIPTLQLIQDVNEVNQHVVSSKTRNGSLTNPIKLLVSKQKRRYKLNGFNLDLTYITEHIIAMGYPAENLESVYRNSMEDVQRFFNINHLNHYKIYNLCSERKYAKDKFNKVAEFGFEDHQAPPFSLIYEFCLDLDEWLKEDEQNVAGIHCKAGKGRTGVMICCYLLFRKLFQNAYDCMRFYGMIRTKNKKGVTIPSQIKYIFYFEKALNNNWVPEKMPNLEIEIAKILMIPVPNFNLFGGCEPWLRIQNKDMEYDSNKDFKLRQFKNEPYVEFNLSGVCCQGDVLLQFFNNSFLNKNDKMFQIWINCDFFGSSGVVMIDKFMLDKACKDKNHKTFQKEFRIEIHTLERSSQQKQSQTVQFIQQNLGF